MKFILDNMLSRLGKVILTLHLGLVPAIVSAADIPDVGDWTENGIAITGGPSGSWDVNISGSISPSAMVKKDGIYYLYYVGADGIRSTDGGPRHRAMGVATSTDGINFTKYGGNPILTFLPHNNEEEGLFSAGAMIDDNGDILIYYSACNAGDSTSESVRCSGYLATSSDGVNFTEQGMVLDQSDSTVWGSGDELFPVGAFKADDTYYVYYIAKGAGVAWELGIASGSSRTNLTSTQAVSPTGGDRVSGGTNVTSLPGNELIIFVVRWTPTKDWYTEARRASSLGPSSMGPIEVTYEFSNTRHTLLYLDSENNRWLMYYLNDAETEIRVKTALATASPPDTIAPSAPSEVK